MANIRVDVNFTIKDGCDIAFKAPCDASAVTGITVYYPNINGVIVSQSFTFKDAHGNNLDNIDNLFTSGALVKIILDTVNNGAYIQNADTNAYLEAQFAQKAPAYTYGTEDLTAGTSALETGKIYLMYE